MRFTRIFYFRCWSLTPDVIQMNTVSKNGWRKKEIHFFLKFFLNFFNNFYSIAFLAFTISLYFPFLEEEKEIAVHFQFLNIFLSVFERNFCYRKRQELSSKRAEVKWKLANLTSLSLNILNNRSRRSNRKKEDCAISFLINDALSEFPDARRLLEHFVKKKKTNSHKNTHTQPTLKDPITRAKGIKAEILQEIEAWKENLILLNSYIFSP